MFFIQTIPMISLALGWRGASSPRHLCLVVNSYWPHCPWSLSNVRNLVTSPKLLVLATLGFLIALTAGIVSGSGPETIGEPLVSRNYIDSAHTAYVYKTGFGSSAVGHTVDTWGFFAGGFDEPNISGGNVTPLLLERVVGDSYVLKAIGQTVAVPVEGLYANLPFDTQEGDATITSANFYIGWKDGTQTSHNFPPTAGSKGGIINFNRPGGFPSGVYTALNGNSSQNITVADIGLTLTFGNNSLGLRQYSLQASAVETAPPDIGGITLVDDNFNDNSLDATIWTADTSAPKGGASVRERNGRIELRSRGWLITKQQFDPITLGGIRITGSIKFNQTSDNFKIMTRNDGGPDNRFGEAREGMMFAVSPSSFQILGKGAADSGTVRSGSTTVNLGRGWFDFEVIDDGVGGLSFSVTPQGGGSTTTITTTTTTGTLSPSFVAFYNREGGRRLAFLDNMVIETVAASDDTAPVVSVPADIIEETTSGAGAEVNFSASADDDVDGPVSASCTPTSGSTFPLGDTTVRCTANDQAGNECAASFPVSVEDTTDPALTIPADVTEEATGEFTSVSIGTATANDLVDANPVITNDAPATFPLGDTAVKWTATDDSGNSTSATQVVTVEDTTPPEITEVTADPSVANRISVKPIVKVNCYLIRSLWHL